MAQTVAAEPLDVQAPVAPAVVVAAPVEAQPVAQAAPQAVATAEEAAAPAAPHPAVEPVQAAGPAPVAAAAAAPAVPRNNGLSPEALQPVLESAGLVWVNTDSAKLRAAQEAAAQVAKPVRVPRERKALPSVDSAPMQQVETAKHPQ